MKKWLTERQSDDFYDAGVHTWVGILLLLVWFVAVPFLIGAYVSGK